MREDGTKNKKKNAEHEVMCTRRKTMDRSNNQYGTKEKDVDMYM